MTVDFGDERLTIGRECAIMFTTRKLSLLVEGGGAEYFFVRFAPVSRAPLLKRRLFLRPRTS